MENKRKQQLDAAKESKRVRRELEQQLIQWGNYDINFPTFNQPSIQEIHDFLQALEKRSSYPHILLSAVNNLPKLEILRFIHYYIPRNDTIILPGLDTLDDILCQPFTRPIFHRSKGPSPSFSIQQLLKDFTPYREKGLHVYDYSVADSSERTRRTTVEEALQRFPSNSSSRPLNFLDIENRTGIAFCPQQIIRYNIQKRIAAQKPDQMGKIDSGWTPKEASEFFLLSSRNAVSSIHIDCGGQLTWIMILEGRKIWYFPRVLNSRTLLWLAEAGSQSPEHYREGWVKVELCPGDLL
jgi:hypothetical protein